MIELLKPRAKRLGQFVDDGRLFFVEDVEYDPAAVRKFLQPAGMPEHLAALRRRSTPLPPSRRRRSRPRFARWRKLAASNRPH